MSSGELEAKWKQAMKLFETTKTEWATSSGKKHKLNAAPLEMIETNFKVLEQYAVIHRNKNPCLCEFYQKFETLLEMLLLASMKMYNTNVIIL
jgi:hypothetical protein